MRMLQSSCDERKVNYDKLRKEIVRKFWISFSMVIFCHETQEISTLSNRCKRSVWKQWCDVWSIYWIEFF